MSRANRDIPLQHQFLAEIIRKELKRHDWTFNMSDDHSVWQKGVKEQKEIKKFIEDAYEIGFDPWKLFYEHYPVEGCDPPEHYGIKINWEEAMDRVASEANEKETIQ